MSLIRKNFQLVLIVRENPTTFNQEKAYAWIEQDKAFEGTMIEMLGLPNPRELWTVRFVSQQIKTWDEYQKFRKELSGETTPIEVKTHLELEQEKKPARKKRVSKKKD